MGQYREAGITRSCYRQASLPMKYLDYSTEAKSNT
ncbi:TPA: hypothetical protein N0F65_002570 [Lagenidium giganteum]|uniref:Uncharacterized protein n=1 Tax=Lagenidium giganteum TaxID=4803 RepID=A0AAV2YXV1_9STRA|nr:TPA: hypothetical protein N0F65_002570 [Lagenidium giganteum]